MYVRASWTREFSTATPARRPSSSTSSSCHCSSRRGGSVTNEMTPISSSPERIGTAATDCSPSSRMMSEARSLSAPPSRPSAGSSDSSTGAPLLPCPQHGAAFVGRVLGELLAKPEAARVAVGERDLAHDSALVGHVHDAPIGDLGDDRPCDLVEHDVVVERRAEQLRGVGQEALRQLRPLDLGDVLDDADREHDVAVLVADRRRLGQAPELVAVLAVDDPQHLRAAPGGR